MRDLERVVGVLERGARRPPVGGEAEHGEGRADAVLVAHRARHGVAECFLVAKREPHVLPQVSRADDPLEAGQRLRVLRACRRGDLGQQRSRHHGADDELARHLGAGVGGQPTEKERAKQRTDLVAGQLPEAAGRACVRYCDGEPVAVGIVGDDEVSAGAPGQRYREVERAWLLRVREPHRRKVRIGLELSVDDVGCGEPGLRERAEREPAGHPVQRRVDEAKPGRAAAARARARR